MRKPIFLVAALLLTSTVVWLLHNEEPESSHQTAELPRPEKKARPEFPNEWVYVQRAYPDRTIDTRAAKAAWTDFKQQRTNRNSSSTGSWVMKGPLNIGGRITGVAISPTDDDVFFIGAASGGIFRTQDAGTTWEPIFDQAGRPSIGALAIAPSDDQRVYAGTGEANASSDTGAYPGDGMYRSDNGGDSWTSIGLEDSQHIGRIVVDPQNADRLFVASAGVLFGTGNNRGLYRSENGGIDWEQVLFVSDSTSCIDVVMHPTNTDTLYAAMWERHRDPWTRSYGGLTSGVHRSFDGGDTWELLSSGLPDADPETGRIGLAISQSDPNVVYASYTTDASTNVFSGLYRSNDHGSTWSLIAYEEISDVNATFGWYFGNVRVHPTDPDDVYVLGQRLYHRQYGETGYWEIDYQMHVDMHDLAFSMNDPEFMLCANDGGLYRSENGGSSWSHYENLPITQFYQIEVDEIDPGRLFGGTQDNNTLRTTAGDPSGYEAILGGDGFHVNVDPTDNNYVYAEYQYGNLFRSTDGGDYMEWATSGIDEDDRNNWNTPVIISPLDSDVLYYGTERVYVSTDRADFWTPISGDLTDGLQPNTFDGLHTLTTIAASAVNEDVIYAGSADGKVSYTYDGGDNWTTVETGLPDLGVSGLALDPLDDQIAYVTFTGYRHLDYAPHVFKTSDGGQSWIDVNGNLPNAPINDILLLTDPHRLIVATDMAVWYSEDDGVNWEILGDDLPTTVMSHLQYHEPTDMLYIGTYGRSMYSYDMAQVDFVGIGEEGAGPTALRLFPNPVQDVINVQLEADQQVERYFISNASGAVIQEGRLTTGITAINVSRLAIGQYVLHFAGESQRLQERFVVSR